MTLSVVYLGINDCGGRGDNVLNAITTKLFDTLRDLYVKATARNFVLIDVPPFERTPQSTFRPSFMHFMFNFLSSIQIEMGGQGE